jgi:hypothetical protein
MNGVIPRRDRRPDAPRGKLEAGRGGAVGHSQRVAGDGDLSGVPRCTSPDSPQISPHRLLGDVLEGHKVAVFRVYVGDGNAAGRGNLWDVKGMKF